MSLDLNNVTPIIGDDRGKIHSTKHSTDDGGGESGSGDDVGDTDTGAGADIDSSSDGSSDSERTECYSDSDTIRIVMTNYLVP